ncbi:MAG: AraC family transcriptional regulator [Clostridia bacterium]|nr:AraC family transcriptional regulator [Clostridia bacterium]
MAISARNLTPEVDDSKEITCAYTCDLLSWVMSHGEEGMAWVTVQTHMNVIAVAVLADMACVVLPEEIDMEEESLKKAIDEGMCVLSSPLTGYEICGVLHAHQVPAHA